MNGCLHGVTHARASASRRWNCCNQMYEDDESLNLYLDASVLFPTLVVEQTSAAVDEFLLCPAE